MTIFFSYWLNISCDCSENFYTDALRQVNAVLLQPHWRHHRGGEPSEAIRYTNKKPEYGEAQ